MHWIEKRLITEKNLWKSAHRDERANEHRCILILGSNQRAAINSRVDCVGHVDAVDATAARFHRTGLVFLIGHPREKVLAVHLWLRFATLWFAVVLVGFAEGYVLWPFGLASFVGVGVLTALVVWRVAPKWLR